MDNYEPEYNTMNNYKAMKEAVKGKPLEWLEHQKFMNDMDDHWSRLDYMWDDVLREAIHEAKEALKHDA